MLWAGCLLAGFAPFLNAQHTACGCNECPQDLPDGFNQAFVLQVQNSANPILGQNGQALCGVRLHFTHEFVCDLLITLRAPNDSTITLLGPVVFFEPTDGSTWEILFVPCSAMAAPDNGFSAQWNNEQTWGAFGNFDGTYYPYVGCLEDFTGSPVNGSWSIDIIDGLPFDEGTLIDFELIFCDMTGIECAPCEANAGNLLESDLEACQGHDSLLLLLQPQYANQQDPPPASTYGYTYTIGGQSGVLLAYADTADLRVYPPGNYTVCGFSYATVDRDSLPQPDGKLTLQELATALASPTPPFCGSLTTNCVNVSILPPLPSVTAQQTVCPGECFDFYGKTYCQSGLYTDTVEQGNCAFEASLELSVLLPDTQWIVETVCWGTCSTTPGFSAFCSAGTYVQVFQNVFGCDSVVVLHLQVLNPVAQIAPPEEWICGQNSLQLQAVAPGTADQFHWTVVAPAQLVGSPDSATVFVSAPGNVQLVNCQSLSGTVCCDTTNVLVTRDTIFLDEPVWASSDSLLCAANSASFRVNNDTEATGYIWSWPTGTSPVGSTTDSSLVLTWSGASVGGPVCVAARNACDTSAFVCQNISVGFPPDPAEILGPDSLCGGSSGWYKTALPLPDSLLIFWSVRGGQIAGQQDSDSILVIWEKGRPNGQVLLQLSSVCGASDTSFFDVTLLQTPDAGTLSGANSFCAGTAALYNYAPSTNAETWLWNISGKADTLGYGMMDSLIVSWTLPGPGYVCVVAQNSCGVASPACIFVNVGQPPVANAGPDTSTCPGLVTLKAQANTGSSAGKWRFLDGPVSVGITNPLPPEIDLDLSFAGDYLFEWTENTPFCSARDTVRVNIKPAPETQALFFDCAANNLTYSVGFSVEGGVPPYLVNGVALAPSNAFLSAPFPMGSPFNFEIVDATGCTNNVGGQYACPCFTMAGAMLTDTLRGCIGDTLQAEQAELSVLDANDAYAYVLHDHAGTALGNILAWNTDGRFAWQPGMIPGQPYYVSFVAGNDTNGFPDVNDPCLSVSSGQVLLFYAIPVADAGADASVCGLEAVLNAAPAMGGSWWVPSDLTINDTQSAAPNINASSPGSYELVWQVNQNGCTEADTIKLVFQRNPVLDSILPACTPDTSGFELRIWVGGGQPPYKAPGLNGVFNGNVFDAGFLPNQSSVLFYAIDANNCSTDTLFFSGFSCSCGTFAGEMPQGLVQLCPGDTLNLSASQNPVLAPGDTLFYALHDEAGAGLGNIFGTSQMPTFAFNSFMQYEKTYYVSAVAYNRGLALQDPCRSVAQGTPVVWHTYPAASWSGAEEACQGDTVRWSLEGKGAYPIDFQLKSDSGSGISVLVNDPLPVEVIIPTTQSDVWRITSISDAFCTQRTPDLEKTLTIWPLPVAVAQVSGEIDCLNDSVLLDATSSAGLGQTLAYTWLINNTTQGTTPLIRTGTAGAGQLVVQTPQGCADQDSFTVQDLRNLPYPSALRVVPVRCFGETNGAVYVDSIYGGTPPVLLRLNGGALGQQNAFTNLPAGDYLLELEDANGCVWAENVSIASPPAIKIDLGADREAAFGDVVYLIANSNVQGPALDTVVWFPVPLEAQVDKDTLRWLAGRSVFITATATDTNGCLATDTVRVLVRRVQRVYVPNIFSPESAGNETWWVFAGPEVVEVERMVVFDRWGNKVFERLDAQPNDLTMGWNGTYQGQTVENGVYVYALRLRLFNGDVLELGGDLTVLK